MPNVKSLNKLAVPGEMPQRIAPMLALLGELPADQKNWSFEYKWDGVRALSYWDGSTLRVESRNLIDVTSRYPELRELGKVLGERRVILDGEIVALDEKKRPSFPRLQHRMHLSPEKVPAALKRIPAFYYVFDLLYLDGQNLMSEFFETRRDVLDALEIKTAHCQVPPSYPGKGAQMLETARKHALEGIVCKKLGSLYLPGRRSPDWRKVKLVKTQELVIGGWIPEINNPQRIGSLQVGYYDNAGSLHYAGGVGTGFNNAMHQMLFARLKPLQTRGSPFMEKVPKRVIFTEPRLVAQVEYRRWPADGQLQQAAFKGLRMDKNAREVLREN